MAQIDIGKLAFTHKGDYAGGTAYVANDVVYYNGSAYIAKQSTTGNLPTDTNNWNTFSAGSGGIWNSALSIGSEGQVVKVSSGALAFGTISSDFVKIAEVSPSGGEIAFNSIASTDYKYYQLEMSQIGCTSSNNDLYLRFRQGSSNKTANNYYAAFLNLSQWF